MRALNSDFNTVGILLPTDIQWNRNYYECGTFSIQLPIDQYSSDMAYIYWKDRPELGKISQLNYKVSNGFTYVQLSGYFIENELNDKVVYPLYTSTGNIEDAVVDMVNTFGSDIPLLDTIVPSLGRGLDVDFQESNANLSDKIYELLEPSELSYRVTYDYNTNSKTFEVWQGLDRTQSQSENNFVVFSSKFGNLVDPYVYIETTDYKNYAIIGGQEDENDNRIYEYLDFSDGGYKKELFVDASSVAYDSDELTLEEYKSNLKTYAYDKLLANVNNVTFDVVSDSYDYLIDYDLGDKCDIIIDDLNIELEARIISINEVIKENEHTVSLEFGDKIRKD